MWQKLIRFTLLLIGALCGLSCAGPSGVEELYGDYKAEFSFGVDTISINTDKTFAQVSYVNGILYNNDGSWRFDEVTNKLTLERCRKISDGFGSRNENIDKLVTCVLPVERYFFNRRLRLGPDEGNPYVKIN